MSSRDRLTSFLAVSSRLNSALVLCHGLFEGAWFVYFLLDELAILSLGP